MSVRHEEKYILDYRQYASIKNRVMSVLSPDEHGVGGSYVITSLYYDDPHDNALLEKLDGLAEHSKFRVRSYDFSDRLVKLERKDKHGILTEKQTAVISPEQIALLGEHSLGERGSDEFALSIQMATACLHPAIAVRYTRDAFFFTGSDLRITFDTHIEAIRPEKDALFNRSISGVPVLDGGCVVMEIKYGSRLPALARKLTAPGGKQLSVSKYALCRESFIF